MKHIISITIIALLGFTACSQYNMDPADITLKGEKIESTTSIQALEQTYMVTNTTSDGYYTADPIKSDNHLVFNGVVTSSDLDGNQYKYVTVQENTDFTAQPRAIRVSIDANNITNLLPIGQQVSVKVNNWHIGQYGKTPQLGMYYIRPKDSRLSPGAMPMPIVRESIFAYGAPDKSLVKPREMTIAQILEFAPKVIDGGLRDRKHHELDWQLIKIKNVHFTQKGDAVGSVNQPKGRIIFAPSTDGIGYPQAIEIADPTGKITINTSEYAKFAQATIPAESYEGEITCIVTWYESRPNTAYGAFQLTLRSLEDLGTGFEEYLKDWK